MVDRLLQLLEACVEGNAWVVSAILDEGVDVDIADDDEVTALQVASANGHEHLVRLLIMKGAALDKANSSGWTPLLQAARHGHTAIVALLLQNQADINAITNLGANAMVLASRGAHLQTCQLLEDYGIDLSFPNGAVDGSTCEFTSVMVAALHGHDNIVRHLVDRSNDVNYRTPTLGVSSLMFAALNGHMTTAQILVERGADPNLTNVNGDTALEIAMVRQRREVQNYLDRKTTRKPRAGEPDYCPPIICSIFRQWKIIQWHLIRFRHLHLMYYNTSAFDTVHLMQYLHLIQCNSLHLIQYNTSEFDIANFHGSKLGKQ